MPLINNLLRTGRGLFEDKVGQKYFPGQQVVPFAPQTQMAFKSAANAAGSAGPLMKQAATAAGGILDGSNPFIRRLSESNPFRSAMLSQGSEAIGDSMRRDFANLGLSGSSLHGRELGRATGDFADRFLSNAYATDQNNALAAAQLQSMMSGQAGNIANNLAIPADILGRVGAQIEQKGQQNIDADMRRYQYEQDAPWARWQQFLQPVTQIGDLFGANAFSNNYTNEQLQKMMQESRTETKTRDSGNPLDFLIKVAPYALAPFTGGASLAAAPFTGAIGGATRPGLMGDGLRG